MRQGVRRPFWLALAASVLIHLGALTAPGWGLPALEDAPAHAPLETRLAPVPVLAPATPASAPAPTVPRPRPSRPAPPAAPVPLPLPLPPAPSEPAPSPEAVLPAPTFEPPPAPAPKPVSEMTNRWPREGRLVFQVTRGEEGLLVGESTHAWQHDGEHYHLQAVTETVGLAALFRAARVEQISTGGFDAYGLRPHRFETLRDGKRRESVHFDVAQGQVFLGNGQSGPLLPGMQDMLALFHQLGAQAVEPGETTLNIATGRKMASFRLILAGVEMVVAPYGEFRARHYRITGDKSDDATEIWIDQQTGLPVRIRHRDRKGDVFDQLVTHIELKEAP